MNSLRISVSFIKYRLLFDIEIENTPHHKAIIKNRDEHYNRFVDRFKKNFDRVMKKYDAIRDEEENYNDYWEKNYNELISKYV